MKKLLKASSIFNTEVQATGLTPNRDASNFALDSNLNTYDTIFFSSDEHEYLFSRTEKFKRCILTITINQGEGWATDSDLDFYYIPPGETNPFNYIHFGNFNYPGMIDYVDHDLEFGITEHGWVFADGIYVVYTGQGIEGGYAYIQEFKAYVIIN